MEEKNIGILGQSLCKLLFCQLFVFFFPRDDQKEKVETSTKHRHNLGSPLAKNYLGLYRIFVLTSFDDTPQGHSQRMSDKFFKDNCLTNS